MKEKNRFLEAALFYAKRKGWAVIPIKAGQKAPAYIRGWERMAVPNEKQIREWWKKWPKANVAIRTGDDILAFDVDETKGGIASFDALQFQHGKLRETLQQRTGGGNGNNFQMIYQRPPGEPLAGGENVCGWAGIDTRCHHNYILAPPSIHPDPPHREYVWDTAKKTMLDEPINPMDDWLIEALRGVQNGGGSQRREFKLPEKIPHGQQHKYLVSLAGKMRAAWAGYDEIVEALWQVNLKRCEKPGPREHIEQYARSVCNYTPGPALEPAPTIEPLAPTVREHSVMAYNADCPEPKAIIDPILYPGLTILGGRPKAGKSWFALQLGLAVVNEGFKLAGYLKVARTCKCLYVSLEDRKPQLKKRLHHLVPDASYLEGLDLMYELAPLMAGGAAQLDETLTREPVDVLIVDSLLAAVQQSGRKNQDIMQADYNIIRTLRELASKHSIAVLLIAHTRKAPGEFLDMIQGTTGTTAAADAIWVLQRTPEGKATLSVTGREVPESVFGMQRAADSPAWIITGEGDEVTQSDARQDIIQLLRDKCGPTGDRDKKPSPGLKPSVIAKELRRPISTVNRLLAALCDLGLVVRTGYGAYNLPGENEPREACE